MSLFGELASFNRAALRATVPVVRHAGFVEDLKHTAIRQYCESGTRCFSESSAFKDTYEEKRRREARKEKRENS
jgi:hypothetical protein